VVKSSPVDFVGGDLADSVLDHLHTIVEEAVLRALYDARHTPGREMSDDQCSEIIASVWRGIRKDLIEEFSASLK